MPGRLLARIRSLLRGLFDRANVEADMSEEFRHHIELRTADLMREGLSRKEAGRRAHLEFGHVETHKETARASRGLRFFDQIRFSWIDVKLGLRMLVKHPGLTAAAIFALAIGIPVGLAPMHLSRAVEAPLPEDSDNRVRAVRYWDPASTSVATTTHFELELLRDELTAFESIGAVRGVAYNIASDDGRAAPVLSAEVTASTFDILQTLPVLGRALDPRDEVIGAANVVLLGYDLWTARFGADPDIIGESVLVAEVPHTVVGIMPSGFLFPTNQQAWLPLREQADTQPGEGVGILIFGRLADGVGADEAQVELSAVGLRARATLSEARARLQPEVVPFGLSYIGIPKGGMGSMPEFFLLQVLALVLLLVACGNVAMLVFARTATRFQELAVRTALGASRGRIVSQMFAEALILAVVAASVGLLSIDWILGRVRLALLVGETVMPYWLTLGVTPEAVVWALGLAALSATVAGVLPALRLTGEKVQDNIRRAEAGRSGIRFGGFTSALIIGDVAVSIAVVGVAIGLSDRLTDATTDQLLTGIPAEEFLSAEIRMPVTRLQVNGGINTGEFRERLAVTQQAVVERLLAEPTVRNVAVADALPRMDHRSRLLELEGVDLPGPYQGIYVRTANVDLDFFEALSHPIRAGRAFDQADLDPDVTPVIVNTVFADRLLGGRDPIGRRVRFVSSGGRRDGPWREIVGVVGHLGINIVSSDGDVGVYLPAAAGTMYPLRLGIQVGSDPQAFAARVREIVAEVDPNAILGSPTVLSQIRPGDWYLMVAVTGGLALLVGILVMLAASGIYAMMSFSVTERTREIGIRTALGAGRSTLAFTILRRSVIQIGVGAIVGAPLAMWAFHAMQSTAAGSGEPGVSFGVGVALAVGIVALVGLLSCVAPTRRVLRIEASAALKGAD